MKRVLSLFGKSVCIALFAFPSWAISLTGAGASAPLPVYAKWAASYYRQTGNKVNYQSIGSGGGQQQISVGTVDFGASDDPMTGPALLEQNLFQFPAVIGATVPVVNLPGVRAGELKLSGSVLANIFLGTVAYWDDPAIARLNPDLTLPNEPIVVVHRADGSGTTFIFTHYLAQVSTAWEDKVGVGKSVRWPVGQGGKGNEGVAAYTRQLSYSIGYVEYAFAAQNELSWVRLQNKEGFYVPPFQENVMAAAAAANWSSAPGMGVVLNNSPGKTAWPIGAASFILLKKTPARPERTQAVLDFFNWAFKEGGPLAKELGYVALPPELVKQIQAKWVTEIQGISISTEWAQ